jgi:hypothetical protein
MDIEFDLVPIESLPVNKILEFLRLTLGHGNEAYTKSDALWQWKHLNSPYGSSYGIAAVNRINHEIIGIRLLMNWILENENSEKIACVRAVDTGTHPDFYRMGIFTALTKKAIFDLTQQKAGIIFNTPNKKSKAGNLKLGWEVVGSWPVYIKILQPFSFIKGILIGRIKNKKQYLPKRSDVFNDKVLSFKELIDKINRKDLDIFLEQAYHTYRKNYGWHIKKDFNYIFWRYGNHPNVDYGFIPLLNDGKLIGLGVLRRNIRYGMVEVVISELLFANSDIILKNDLLRVIKKNISADYLIAHYNVHTPELLALKKNSFIKAPGQHIDFIIKELTTKSERFNRLKYWNLSLGDIELL